MEVAKQSECSREREGERERGEGLGERERTTSTTYARRPQWNRSSAGALTGLKCSAC